MYFTFSITGAHINNFLHSLEAMHYVKKYKYNYKKHHNKVSKIFRDNVQNGIVAVYSLNALFESVINIIDNFVDLQYLANKKYSHRKSTLKGKLEVLKDMNIIKNNEACDKCLKLNKLNSRINKCSNDSNSLNIPIEYYYYCMVNENESKNLSQEFISTLTRENLEEYFNAFREVIRDICTNDFLVKENYELIMIIEEILCGKIEIQKFGSKINYTLYENILTDERSNKDNEEIKVEYKYSKYESINIYEALTTKYNSYLRCEIKSVSIIQSEDTVWLEIIEIEELGNRLKKQIVSRDDLSFIVDESSNEYEDNELFFSPSMPVEYNANRFIEEYDPISIMMTTNLFKREVWDEIKELRL